MSGSYTDVFGGSTVFPAQLSYQALTLTVNTALVWPREQQGPNAATDIMDVQTAVPGLHLSMPDARQASNGDSVLLNNVGAETIIIDAFDGTQLLSLTAGTTWVLYLTDNTSSGGAWRTFQFGASVSVADAAALAGAGLKSIGSTLNQAMPVVSKNLDYTLIDGDRAKTLLWTGGAGTFTLPDPAAVGADWFASIRNAGSGNLTLTPSVGQLDGAASIALDPSDSAFIVSDGANFYTVGLGQAVTSVFDFIQISVPGTGTYTLSGSELNRISYRFTGLLTGDRTIVVPATIQQYWVANATTGAFHLYVKTAAQAAPGIEVVQGDTAIFYCDATNVINAAKTAALALPIAIAQGGTGANTAAGARTNLNVPANTRQIISGNGLTGGGDFSADRTLAVGAGTGITVAADTVGIDTTVVPRKNVANSFTAEQSVSSTAPVWRLEETDAAANEKVWAIRAAGGEFAIVTRTDADGAGAEAISIGRTGTAVTTIDLQGTATVFGKEIEAGIIDGYHTATESVNNSTALQDDNFIVGLPLDDSSYYEFDLYLYWSVAPGSGVKFQFVFSSAPDFSVATWMLSDGTILPGVLMDDLVTNAVAGGQFSVIGHGSFRANLGAGGTLKLRWAQNTAVPFNLVMGKGSYIRIRKL